MTIRFAYKRKRTLTDGFITELSGIYDEREAQNLAKLVIEDITGRPHLELFLSADDEWSVPELEKIESILNRLFRGEPIQYILGYTYFSDLRFDLEPGVLIPRNETEELVEWVVSDNKDSHSPIKILDVGCGSGAIAVALSNKLPNAEVIAVDISDKALEMCQKNAKKNGVNISCRKLDILNPSGEIALEEFDIIVSNPPYVLESQRPFLEKRVTEMEPSLALFVPDTDPLLFYRALAEFSNKQLKPGGKIYVEINDLLGKQSIAEFNKFFTYTELKQDIHGKDRMIKASNGKE